MDTIESRLCLMVALELQGTLWRARGRRNYWARAPAEVPLITNHGWEENEDKGVRGKDLPPLEGGLCNGMVDQIRSVAGQLMLRDIGARID